MNATEAEGPESALPKGATPDQPVARADRIVALDFIRGISVLGILIVNIAAFAHPTMAFYWPGALPGGGNDADKWVWLFQLVFVDGKFRGLFTLLFGAGMALFMERVWARGGSRSMQARRLAWLALFGLAHFFLLFVGDILFLYSVAGLLALAMMRWRARTQLRVGLIWYLLGAVAFAGALGSQAMFESMPEIREQAGDAWEQIDAAWQQQVADAAAEAEVVGSGSYGEIVAYRFTEQSVQLAAYAGIAIVETVPLMLIGMALYRLGFFSGAFDPMRMRRWGWTGFVGGALVSLALGWPALARDFPPFLTQFVFNGASAFPRLPMILGIAALLALWAPSASRGWLGGRVVAAGRMAFSNYIGTSVVMLLVFHALGLGLYGELHRLALLPFLLLVWVLILAWSKPWLERFRFGPLEWLWRCLTYGRVFAFRR